MGRRRDSRRFVAPVFVGLTYGAFFVHLLLQHQSMFLAHDDYGLAVLHYVTVQTGFQGQDFTLAHVLSFLADEYGRWSGRVASYFFHIYAQKIGLDFARFVQCLVIVSIAFLSWVLSRDREEAAPPVGLGPLPPLVPVLLFLALPIGTLTDGVYWFAASVTHVWGVPLFLTAACLARSAERLPAPSVLLLALAAAFSEQMSIAAVVYVTAFLATGYDRGLREVGRAAVRCIPVFLAAAATILAPGNFARLEAMGAADYDQLGAAGVFIRNVEAIVVRLFWLSEYNPFVAFTLLGVFTMLSWLLFVAPRDSLPGLPGSADGRDGRHLTAVLLPAAVPFLLVPFAQEKWRFAVGLSVIVAFSLLLLCRARSSSSGRAVLCAHAAGLASLAPLLFAPGGVAPRALLPFLLLEFLPVTYAIAVAAGPWTRRVALAAVCVLGIGAAGQAAVVFEGYRSNREIHEANDAQLRVTSFRQRNGMGADEPVTLFRLQDGRFGTTMPYQRPLIEVWMKKYYRLAPDTQFTWE